MRQTTLPQATEVTPLVRRLCLVNFIFCLGAAPMFFVIANKAMTFNVLYVAGAVMCLMALLASAMGFLRSTPLLVWSMMLSIGASYGMLCTGGLCVLYLPFASAELTSATDAQYAKSIVLENELTTQAAYERAYLQVGGGVQLALGLVTSYLVRQLFHVLGEKRAAVAFLQAFSAFMLPLSMLFIAGGQYIISSQTLASAPYTGIFIYICGLLVLVLSLLAFIGSGFEYRRLLNTFSWFAFLTGILLMGAAVACFAVASNVETSVVKNWSSIRVILPPTLQARYDKTQFTLFVQRNLNGMAYVSIISGLFMLLQSLSAQSVRDITNVVKRRANQDKRCALDPDVHPDFVARREWALMFKSSKRNTRICMRVACGLATLLLLAISAIMTLSVIFTTQCASISKASNANSAPLLGSTNTTSMCTTIKVGNEFAAGKLQVAQGYSRRGNVTVTQNAVSDKYLTTDTLTNKVMNSTCVVQAAPTQTPTFMWFDTSCQVATLMVELPALSSTAAAPFLDLNSKTSEIDINLLLNGTSSLLVGMNVTTDQSNVKANGAYIGSQGLSITSNSGEINVTTLFVNATGPVGAKAPTTLTSSLGSVSLNNASLLDSPLTVSTDVSGIMLNNVITYVAR
ncbi:hypothetical protein As57867_010211, partial [Aphanomyces stellatus]